MALQAGLLRAARVPDPARGSVWRVPGSARQRAGQGAPADRPDPGRDSFRSHVPGERRQEVASLEDTHPVTELRRGYWVYVPQGETVHHLIRLPASLEEYIGKFGVDGRKKLRKWPRALAQACGGGLEIRRITREDQVPQFLSQAEMISLKSWKAPALGRVLRSTEQRAAAERIRQLGMAAILPPPVRRCAGGLLHLLPERRSVVSG